MPGPLATHPVVLGAVAPIGPKPRPSGRASHARTPRWYSRGVLSQALQSATKVCSLQRYGANLELGRTRRHLAAPLGTPPQAPGEPSADPIAVPNRL